MSIIPNTGWPTISENSDALRDKQDANAEYAALENKPLDLDGARDALWGMWEIDPETGKQIAEEALSNEAAEKNNPEEDLFAELDAVGNWDWYKTLLWNSWNDLLSQSTVPKNTMEEKTTNRISGADKEFYNPETYSGQIRTRMAERFDTENGWNADLLEEQLSTTEWRAHNSKQIDTLFFGSDILEKSLSPLSESDKQENLDWFEVNTTEGGPLEESFERIKGNFVLPLTLQDKELSQIHTENPENLKIVNEALADAILLEVAQHTTQWKVNYSEVAVKALIHEIKDINTPATEKIRKFWEIHTLVNTGAAKWGYKQSREFRERRLAGKQSIEANQAFQTTQAEQVKNNWVHSEQTDNTETFQEENTPQWWEVFTATKIDTAMTWNESWSETA